MVQTALKAYEYAIKCAEERHRDYERTPYGQKPFYPTEEALYGFFSDYLIDEGYNEDEIVNMWKSSEVQSSFLVDQELAKEDGK